MPPFNIKSMDDFDWPPAIPPKPTVATPIKHKGIILNPKGKTNAGVPRMIINAYPEDVDRVKEQVKYLPGAVVQTIPRPEDDPYVPEVEIKTPVPKKAPGSPQKPKALAPKPHAVRAMDVQHLLEAGPDSFLVLRARNKRFHAEKEVYRLSSEDMARLEMRTIDDDASDFSFVWDYDIECKVLDMADIYDETTNKHDYSKIVFSRRDQVYYVSIACMDFDLSYALAQHRLPALVPIATLIPKNEYSPIFPKTGLSKLGSPLPNIFVKRPVLLDHTLGDDTTNTIIISEAVFCENLIRHPHPNLARYYGCEVRDGRITGLCFKRYKEDLNDRIIRLVEKGPITETMAEDWIAEIEAGMEHIHALGYAHNDLNPQNIMFDEESDRPVIIDFDSTARIGMKLLKSGTLEWMPDKPFVRAEERNDVFGVAKIREYLAKFAEDIEEEESDEEEKIVTK